MSGHLRIPIFPLRVVAFPYEIIPLHIFELRYRRMIEFCEATGRGFGIIPVDGQDMSQRGTLMELERVVNRHEDGRMDILVKGRAVFEVIELIAAQQSDFYHEAEVVLCEAEDTSSFIAQESLKISFLKLLEFMEDEPRHPADPQQPYSYQIAHYVGLTPTQLIQLLYLEDEAARVQLLQRHLVQLLPKLEGLAVSRQRIRMNGHYRDLPGVELDLSKFA